MKYKIGDRVRIIKGNSTRYCSWINNMDSYVGREVDIVRVLDNGDGHPFYYFNDGGEESYSVVEEWLIPQRELKGFPSNKNAKELGIDTSRKFVVIGDTSQEGLKLGTVVTVYRDDDSRCPYFNYYPKLSTSSTIDRCIYWENLAYYDEPEREFKGLDVMPQATCPGGSATCPCRDSHGIVPKEPYYECGGMKFKFAVGAEEKPKRKSMLRTISDYIKLNLSADNQALYRAGYINGDLEPTDKAVKALVYLAFVANHDALVAKANEDIANAEKECKKDC